MTGPTRSIIVVDDIPDVRQAIYHMGRSLGYAVETYASAIDFLLDYDPPAEQEQCLLLDYQLPEMNGLELIKQLNARAIPIPVVLIAGRLDADVAVTAMRWGAVNCVQKPFTLLQFQEVVEEALASWGHLQNIFEARAHRQHFEQLTGDEQEIVRLAANGHANNQIAAQLDLAIETVDESLCRACATLKVDCTAQMIRAVTLQSLHGLFHPKAGRVNVKTSLTEPLSRS